MSTMSTASVHAPFRSRSADTHPSLNARTLPKHHRGMGETNKHLQSPAAENNSRVAAPTAQLPVAYGPELSRNNTPVESPHARDASHYQRLSAADDSHAADTATRNMTQVPAHLLTRRDADSSPMSSGAQVHASRTSVSSPHDNLDGRPPTSASTGSSRKGSYSLTIAEVLDQLPTTHLDTKSAPTHNTRVTDPHGHIGRPHRRPTSAGNFRTDALRRRRAASRSRPRPKHIPPPPGFIPPHVFAAAARKQDQNGVVVGTPDCIRLYRKRPRFAYESREPAYKY